MPEPLTTLQQFYVDAIILGLSVAGLVAAFVVFTCGFLIVRGMQS